MRRRIRSIIFYLKATAWYIAVRPFERRRLNEISKAQDEYTKTKDNKA